MDTDKQQMMTEIEEIFRQQVETSVLIDRDRLRARVDQILEQWQALDAQLEPAECVLRAFLLAAWELHPLPPRLERQLVSLEQASGFAAAIYRAAMELPHKLVEQHWNLVRKAAGRYHIPSELENEAEFQELMSVGREALFIAAQKYYRKPKGSFGNYAWATLREKMRDEQGRKHPVPPKMRKKLGLLSRLRETYHLSDKTLDKEAISRELGVSGPELFELLQVEGVWGNGLQFETQVELEDLEAPDQSLDQLSMLLEIEDSLRLEGALEQMDGLEKVLLGKLYFEEKSLREVAEEMQMSLPSFKKLHKRALYTMKQHLSDGEN